MKLASQNQMENPTAVVLPSTLLQSGGAEQSLAARSLLDSPEQELKILLVEDVSSDAELIERELRRALLRFGSRRAETKEEFAGALEDFGPDVILAD